MKRLAVVLAFVLLPLSAHAGAEGVGLGVAGGVAYSGTKLTVDGAKKALGARFAWGFFVDIPLLETFYITPSTMIYDVDADGDGDRSPATDIDLNFKFIVPISSLRLGAGVTGGISTGLDPNNYVPHWGLLGLASYNVVSNLDAFALVQYKKQLRETGANIDDIHAFLGGMFHF